MHYSDLTGSGTVKMRRNHSYKIRMERAEISFNIVGFVFISFFAFLALVPFIFIVSGSLTKESAIYRYGYSIIPHQFSLEAYRVLFKAPARILNAYFVTIMLEVFGTTTSMFLVSLTAYVLYRRSFRYRNFFALMFYFTSLFSGGLIPTYIWIVRYLHLKNTFFALLLPPLMGPWLIFLMRNFMSSIPESLVESAKMDGAGEFKIFWNVILPLAVPGLATVGLFKGLAYWNDWFLARLYIEKEKLFPLQYFLYNILHTAEGIDRAVAQSGIPLPKLPSQSLKLAISVVAIGPVIFLYPLVQRYFIKGITIGSVKG